MNTPPRRPVADEPPPAPRRTSQADLQRALLAGDDEGLLFELINAGHHRAEICAAAISGIGDAQRRGRAAGVDLSMLRRLLQ